MSASNGRRRGLEVRIWARVQLLAVDHGATLDKVPWTAWAGPKCRLTTWGMFRGSRERKRGLYTNGHWQTQALTEMRNLNALGNL